MKKLGVSLSSYHEVRGHRVIRVSGEEKYIWSYFPDIMLDRIQLDMLLFLPLKRCMMFQRSC